MAEHHRDPGDLVGGLVVGEDAVRDQLVALDALDEHLEAHLVVEVIPGSWSMVSRWARSAPHLPAWLAGWDRGPPRTTRSPSPPTYGVGDLGLGQGHAVARRQGDARSAQRVRQHRDRVMHARPGELEALRALGRDRRFLLLRQPPACCPGPGAGEARGHELVQPSLQGIERGLPRTGEVGRHAIDGPGDGRGVQWSSREPVADLAFVEQPASSSDLSTELPAQRPACRPGREGRPGTARTGSRLPRTGTSGRRRTPAARRGRRSDRPGARPIRAGAAERSVRSMLSCRAR